MRTCFRCRLWLCSGGGWGGPPGPADKPNTALALRKLRFRLACHRHPLAAPLPPSLSNTDKKRAHARTPSSPQATVLINVKGKLTNCTPHVKKDVSRIRNLTRKQNIIVTEETVMNAPLVNRTCSAKVSLSCVQAFRAHATSTLVFLSQ